MFRRFCCALLATSLLAAFAVSSPLQAQDEVAKPVDQYAVPENDVAAIVDFLNRLEAYRPTTTEEVLAYRQHARKALETAANRIVKLEKDKTSDAYRKATVIRLQLGLSDVQHGTAETQQSFYKDVLAHLKSAKAPSQQDLALAYTFGQVIEQVGNLNLAKEAYTEFGKYFSKSDDEKLAGYGEMMAGTARRLELPGKEMNLEGTTTSGEAFDWKAYRGKVVLVDYWATWCGPCVQELPNVLENYEKYHDKGFDVVGISLDTDPAKLSRFIAERELPWVCLFEEGAGTNNAMAKRYGVMRIPTTMLLDREGKVVAMDVRGGELGRQLAALLGPVEEKESAQ
ncbi:MAG: TlpA family protein disulfide reductase [Planctomycetaceae bacterium]|nr:TlpA family protein disulfide reductase [Planctomycetales bacterium]MCB9940943.1 TlpA family protein disulfide reductase [Planctomycetaceae bacterium]